MSGQARLILKLSGAVVLAVVAIWFVGSRYGRFRRAGENGAQVWFYDQQRKHVYAASRDTIPPDGHGVRAVVVAFRGEENEPAKRRVAYLETYGQPLKDALERAKAARNSGKTLKEPPPGRESPLFQTNNLVRRVDETAWHVAGSPEGRQLMAEWKSRRAPDGREPVVCMP
jgi:hypothetical protein